MKTLRKMMKYSLTYMIIKIEPYLLDYCLSEYYIDQYNYLY
jgi:hypothetical protein